ncbi:hypothetical protein B566_EDAN008724 [Ephemera danica]|nr:hypothetical protein B566_EDAN008724 [Ephemera danica]
MRFYLGFLALLILAIVMHDSVDAKKYRKDKPIVRPADCFDPPAVVGHCKGAFPRFSFIKCKEFSYGGCGGNKNNFLTKDECNCKCKAKKDHTYKKDH